MTKLPKRKPRPDRQDGYYWAASHGNPHVMWVEDGIGLLHGETTTFDQVVLYDGPLPFPTPLDLKRWEADPVMAELKLEAMETDWPDGYYWVWTRRYPKPLIAHCIQTSWSAVREYEAEEPIGVGEEQEILDGLVLYGPLEPPPIPKRHCNRIRELIRQGY